MSIRIQCGFEGSAETVEGKTINEAGSLNFEPEISDEDDPTSYDDRDAFSDACQFAAFHLFNLFKGEGQIYEMTVTVRNVQWLTDDD